MTTILFLGGWLAPFGSCRSPGFRCVLVHRQDLRLLFVFLWVRATFPRYRYDQLMRLGWKVFLPLSLLWLVLTAGALLRNFRVAAACRVSTEAKVLSMAFARPHRAQPAAGRTCSPACG